MASVLQNLISKLGADDAYKLVNRMKSGASQLDVEDMAKYPANITQDALADRQGFKMVGEAFPTDFTIVPEGASVPALRTQTLPKAQAIIPEVVDESFPVALRQGDNLPALVQDASVSAPNKSNLLRNLAIGGGAAGLVGLGMMSGDSEQPQSVKGVMAPVSKQEQKSTPKAEQPNTVSTTTKTSAKTGGNIPVAKAAVASEAPRQPQETVDDYEARLAAARQQDADKGLLFGLLKAAQMGGSSLAGTKADTSFADSELAKGDEFTNRFTQDEKLKQERLDILDEKKLKDPNSAESMYMRDQMAKIGFPVSSNISAADLKKQGINLSNLLTQKMAIDARKEAAALQREALSLAKSEKKEQKELENQLKAQKSVDSMVTNLYKSKAYEGYEGTKAAQAALDNAIAKGDKTSIGSAFMMYAKIAQGDNSVVRESDMKNLAGSYNYTSPSEMIAKLSAKAAGGQFTQQELGQMKEVANLIERVKATQVQRILSPIQTRIENYKLNPAESIDPQLVDEFKNAGKSTTVNEGTSKKTMKLPSAQAPGAIINQKSTGKRFRVNADGTTATEI